MSGPYVSGSFLSQFHLLDLREGFRVRVSTLLCSEYGSAMRGSRYLSSPSGICHLLAKPPHRSIRIPQKHPASPRQRVSVHGVDSDRGEDSSGRNEGLRRRSGIRSTVSLNIVAFCKIRQTVLQDARFCRSTGIEGCRITVGLSFAMRIRL